MSINNESLIDILMGFFDMFKRADELHARTNRENLNFDASFIEEVMKKAISASGFVLTDDQIESFRKKIISTYEVFQPEGEFLLGNYEHEDWYPREGEPRPYWERYKRFLLTKNPYLQSTIDTFEKNTDKITNFFGDPKADEAFQIHGLVMGDVQSGKTSTYIGTICKAVDAGYKVIILLTGVVESLRKQTQRRVEEGFVGFDSTKEEQVGVGVGSPLKYPKALTSRHSDYTGSNINKNTVSTIYDDDPAPLIYVCKKNVSVLTKIIGSLKALNTTKNRKHINAPLLLIDDEADNASINTNDTDLDPTKINKGIRSLLKLFTKATYVGFTATPFANVFIQPNSEEEMLGNDLFPNDFIFSLKAPSNYVGPMSVFGEKGEHKGSLVRLNDWFNNSDLFSYSHKKDWDGQKLFPSLYDSIITFCLANAIRDLRGQINEHRSMLVNMSRFKAVQEKIKDIVTDYFKNLKKTIRLYSKSSVSRASYTDPLMLKIHSVWRNQYEGKVEFTWKDVLVQLYKSIETIEIRVVNSGSKEKLDYDEHKEGLRVIAIGGLALSRGLTLEGLMTSYFFRNTSTYDVLMQMGRWFGYRLGYDDVCRIWITDTSALWYKEIAEAIKELREDISRMNEKKITPKEFGVRVRNDSDELGITAHNKMRNTIDRIGRGNGSSFYGNIFETVYLSKRFEDNKHNKECVQRLIDGLPEKDKSIAQPYFRNVSRDLISDIVESLVLPRISVQFDQDQLVPFIRNNQDKSLDKWDVLFVSKTGGTENLNLTDKITISPILRVSESTKDDNIAVSKKSAHIGSRDTKVGLTKEQIETIENERSNNAKSTKESDYMIEGRNPLFIVYFLKIVLDDAPYLDHSSITPDGFFPAFAVCFPKSKAYGTAENHLYKVNVDADYFSKAGYKTENKPEEEEL